MMLMSKYYLVKDNQSEALSLSQQYFNADDQNFTINIKNMTLFRDIESVEAFKRVLEFYGHDGLAIKEIG
jgi:hypothetical protein